MTLSFGGMGVFARTERGSRDLESTNNVRSATLKFQLVDHVAYRPECSHESHHEQQPTKRNLYVILYILTSWHSHGEFCEFESKREGGRGEGRSFPGRTSSFGVRLSSGYISPSDWDTLTCEKREYVYHLREERDRRVQNGEDEAFGGLRGRERVDGYGNELNREGEPSEESGARTETPPANLSLYFYRKHIQSRRRKGTLTKEQLVNRCA
jgi:hypothetical protein